MKIVLMGTDHTTGEEGLEVSLEYDLEDTWTFRSVKFNFTISDVGSAMNFLSKKDKGEKRLQGREKMAIAKGICSKCGGRCHLTKHYGWQHDRKNPQADKEHFALVKEEVC